MKLGEWYKRWKVGEVVQEQFMLWEDVDGFHPRIPLDLSDAVGES